MLKLFSLRLQRSAFLSSQILTVSLVRLIVMESKTSHICFYLSFH